MSDRYGSDGRRQIDVPGVSIVSGVLALAAGTQTASSGTVAFSNSNNVSFGMSGSNQITGSYAFLASAGTQSSSVNGLTFAASNGVSFGLSNGTITASISTAAATGNNINISAGTTSNDLSAFTLADSNGLSFGLNASTITGTYYRPVASNAIQSVGSATNSGTNTSRFAPDDHIHAGVFSVGVSTGGNTIGDTRVDVGRFVFQGGNNITLSQITAANALNTIVLSGANAAGAQTAISGIANSETTYTSGTVSFSELGAITIRSTTGQQFQFSVNAQTNQTAGIYASGNTTGQSSSSTYDARSLSFSGAGIASVGWSNSSWIVSATQSNQALSGSNGSFTFQTATFGNANGLSFLTTNGSMIGSYTVPTVTNSSWTASDSATSLTIGQLAFTGSNGITMALATTTGGSATITATYTVPSNFNRIAASNFTASAGQSVLFANSNNITFGLDAGVAHSKMTASYEFDISAGTASSGVNAVTFSDANGVFWGFDGSNVTANPGYLSYYQNQPWIVATNSQTHGNSTVGLMPFHMPLAGSFSYLRIPNSFSTNNTTQTATTNSSFGFSASVLSTFFAVVYSQGVGANSRSLQFVASGSAGFSQQISMSVSSGVNGSGTRWSVTQKYTYPSEGFTTANTSYTTAQSSGILGVNTESANSDFNFMRPLDIPFANSLSAGAYWIAIGRSSTTSTQSLNFVTGAKIDHSNVCATQANQAWGLLGQATASSNQLQKGIGSYTTNAMTTASIALSQISSSVSHLHPYFELHREA